MRENKTRYAVLGMLSRGSMSGYDIRKALQEGMRTFWSESNGQIYPIIKQLADEGLASKIVEKQEGKPDRHVYSLTESGRAELRRWLDEPAEEARFRLEFLLKTFFGHETTVARNIEHLEQVRAQQQAQLDEFLAMERHLKNEHLADNPMAPYWLLTLRCGIRVWQACLDWCDEGIAALSEERRKESDE